jgi:hypothetical protein
MRENIRQEEEEERMCMLFLRDQPTKANLFVRGVVTRSGKAVHPPSGSETDSESDDEIEELGGEEPGAPSPTADPLLGNPSKHVTFMPELELVPDEAGNLEEVVHQQEDQQLTVEESPDEVIEVTQPGLGGEPSLGDSHQGGPDQPLL